MAPRKLTIDDYEITKDGQIINRHTGHVLKPQPNGKGYLRVSIGKKLQFVHRLVAEKYIPNPEGKEQVNHKDGNKLNNSADNLEWVTNQENRTHAVETGLHLEGENCPWSKLTASDVHFIREHPEIDPWDLADILHVSATTIRDARDGRTWKQLKSYAELTQNNEVLEE